ncbi:N-succinylarginine dihydrolase [Acerihabitans sp. TG2]|uniref:N-succinylarginine dihydrolase n=1 Tax=Acerihabitans sp. TG2 TaxID=3096008 RepID=UPI002B225265|nr:N-succinylarginine dihydrolase [Acerihabitans sp. TG2]MEA9391058.1 N-succinylarginine dihydrolase [Acerihabitans sp. TG2]
MPHSVELNLDGLVGATHHYAGLSFGNEASTRHNQQVANPRLAARQGLEKMKTLADAGFAQGILPPQERPHIGYLRQLGFSGTDAQILSQVATRYPQLLSAVSSASAMWVANAATVSPSADSADGKVHFTPANLHNKFHRAIEADTTSAILRAVFHDKRYFQHHAMLPQSALFGDEGAANHNRLGDYQGPGVQMFVYGTRGFDTATGPVRYPARQTLEASEAVARLHQLEPARCLLVQQHPQVIDQGVFHNDVIAVSNERVLFYHQRAFVDNQAVRDDLQRSLAQLGQEFMPIEVPERRVSVADAVGTYLFNSQLLSRRDGKMTIVVPQEVPEHPAVWEYLRELVAEGRAIDDIKVFDLRESMRNGGGPACLRLRVILSAQEYQHMNQCCLLTDDRVVQLNRWIDRHYRDRLCQADLADPMLLNEVRTGLDELTQLLALGSIYPFQHQ